MVHTTSAGVPANHSDAVSQSVLLVDLLQCILVSAYHYSPVVLPQQKNVAGGMLQNVFFSCQIDAGVVAVHAENVHKLLPLEKVRRCTFQDTAALHIVPVKGFVN
jgi:hypothetical protein